MSSALIHPPSSTADRRRAGAILRGWPAGMRSSPTGRRAHAVIPQARTPPPGSSSVDAQLAPAPRGRAASPPAPAAAAAAGHAELRRERRRQRGQRHSRRCRAEAQAQEIELQFAAPIAEGMVARRACRNRARHPARPRASVHRAVRSGGLRDPRRLSAACPQRIRQGFQPRLQAGVQHVRCGCRTRPRSSARHQPARSAAGRAGHRPQRPMHPASASVTLSAPPRPVWPSDRPSSACSRPHHAGGQREQRFVVRRVRAELQRRIVQIRRRARRQRRAGVKPSVSGCSAAARPAAVPVGAAGRLQPGMQAEVAVDQPVPGPQAVAVELEFELPRPVRPPWRWRARCRAGDRRRPAALPVESFEEGRGGGDLERGCALQRAVGRQRAARSGRRSPGRARRPCLPAAGGRPRRGAASPPAAANNRRAPGGGSSTRASTSSTAVNGRGGGELRACGPGQGAQAGERVAAVVRGDEGAVAGLRCARAEPALAPGAGTPVELHALDVLLGVEAQARLAAEPSSQRQSTRASVKFRPCAAAVRDTSRRAAGRRGRRRSASASSAGAPLRPAKRCQRR